MQHFYKKKIKKISTNKQDEKYINLMKSNFVHLTKTMNIDWVNVNINNNETLF